jgi:hypothetical protein
MICSEIEKKKCGSERNTKEQNEKSEGKCTFLVISKSKHKQMKERKHNTTYPESRNRCSCSNAIILECTPDVAAI